MVLVTGAAGGLGQGIVAEFAAQGWRVAAGWHRGTSQVETAQIWPVQLEVTSRASVDQAVQALLARWSRVDVLINNAGLTADHLVGQMPEEDWDRVLAVNLKGAFLCSQAVPRTMIKQRDGQIINLSSFGARSGPKGQANYAAAKAGLLGLTQSLAREVGSRNVRVNAVLPGVLPTPMTAALPTGVMDEFAAANALGRINRVDEVARFIVFLAAMRNVSGQLFQLDSRIGRWT
ncbi:MAG: SDR family NAD(P)-dependent oxidoreductase [Pedosphaera parvula]|nr:SDR family NAD(P)-dependent oxidoreductase [Pedosphaera parvula]